MSTGEQLAGAAFAGIAAGIAIAVMAGALWLAMRGIGIALEAVNDWRQR